MPLFNVIKYEGDNDTFIWKHPCEDFNAFSQLVVHENQEAIFFNNGQALDSFGPGRHTLKSQNIPLIREAIGLAAGGISPFHCEVYFIDKTEKMAMKWGTDSRIQFMEPTYNFPLSIGASGEMSLQIKDGRTLLIRLVGTEDDLTEENLISMFRAFLITRIKSYISRIIKDQKISIFEIDNHLSEFSDEIKALLQPDFAAYGLSLERFLVTRVMKPDGENQYEKFKELHFRQYADIAEARIRQQKEMIDAETAAKKVVIDSKAQATKRTQEGYTYAQERGFDVAEKVADNEAVGEFTNMGVGFGTMAGVGGAVGGMVGNIMNESMSAAVSSSSQQAQTATFCENCGSRLLPGASFCEECGSPVVRSNSSCRSCGYIFDHPCKFCPHCGAKRG